MSNWCIRQIEHTIEGGTHELRNEMESMSPMNTWLVRHPLPPSTEATPHLLPLLRILSGNFLSKMREYECEPALVTASGLLEKAAASDATSYSQL